MYTRSAAGRLPILPMPMSCLEVVMSERPDEIDPLPDDDMAPETPDEIPYEDDPLGDDEDVPETPEDV